MQVYIVCFVLSIICLFFSEEITRNKMLRNSLIVFALCLPVFVAAFRAESVGTDILVYVKPLYTAAISADSLLEYYSSCWFSSWRDVYVREFEYGFSLVIYLVVKITRSFRCVLAAIEILVIVPVYMSLRNFKTKRWLGMLVFYFMFFNISLNLMRQMIACAFCLLSYTYLINGSRKKYFKWNVVALFFHNTAIIGFGFFIIYYFVVRDADKGKNNRSISVRLGRIKFSQYSLKTAQLLMLVILCLFLMPLLISVARIILDNSWYLSGDFHLMPNQALIRLPLLLSLILSRKHFRGNQKLYSVFLANQYVELMLSQLAGLSDQTVRIVYYFSIINIIMIPYVCYTTHKLKRNILQLYYLGYCILYWLYYFAYLQTAHTVPYLMG